LGFGWWVFAERQTPGFVWYTLIDNHVLNVLRARRFPDEDVPLSAAQFLMVALLGASPWVLSAGATLWSLVRRRAWRDPRETPLVALALWALGVLVLTALSPFRLLHYGLPAYSAVALLAARGWESYGGRRLVAAHAGVFAALALACALFWASDGRHFLESVLRATDIATRKSAAAALSLVSAHRAVQGIGLELARRIRPDDLLVHEGALENSGALEWYTGHRPVIVDGRRSVLAFGALRPEARDLFWDAARLEKAWGGGSRVWVVSLRAPGASVVPRLPGARLVAASGGRWLWVNAIGGRGDGP